MKIIPLVAPKVNWADFVPMVQEATGKSPTRILDQTGRKLSDLLAFPLILGLDGSAATEKLQSSFRLDHLSLSFLVMSEHHLGNISSIIDLNVYAFPVDPYHNQCLTMLTGTLTQWRASIYHVLTTTESMLPQIKEAMTLIYESFINKNEIWCGRWRIP